MQLIYKGINIAAISDTHGNHRKLVIPNDAEIIVHCGDVCCSGNESQLMDFFDWFSLLPIKYKIFVAGNHDFPFELEPEKVACIVPNNVYYLNDSSIVIHDIHFHSLSARPWLHHCEDTPYGTDILITHGAPFGILDEGIGCPFLLKLVANSKIPIHLFGHIHSFGNKCIQTNKTFYCNVAEFNNLID